MPRVRRLLLPTAAVVMVGALALALRPRPVDVEMARVVRGHFEASIVEDGKTRVREALFLQGSLFHLRRIHRLRNHASHRRS